MPVLVKRAYDPPAPEDGYRVLVDRLWPRGLTKEKLQTDAWLKDLAPSDELRRWFGHDRARWPEFRRRYLQELQGERQQELLRELAERAAQSIVTLVYSARDEECNNAVVLQQSVGESQPRRTHAGPQISRKESNA